MAASVCSRLGPKDHQNSRARTIWWYTAVLSYAFTFVWEPVFVWELVLRSSFACCTIFPTKRRVSNTTVPPTHPPNYYVRNILEHLKSQSLRCSFSHRVSIDFLFFFKSPVPVLVREVHVYPVIHIYEFTL
jgi:hypothetical protein